MYAILINGHTFKDAKTGRAITYTSWTKAQFELAHIRNQMPGFFDDSQVISYQEKVNHVCN